MISKRELAQQLGVSFKTIYSYCDKLKITSTKLNEEEIKKITEYKEQHHNKKSKTTMYDEIMQLKEKIANLESENKELKEYKNGAITKITGDIALIEQKMVYMEKNVSLLLMPPKNEEKGLIRRFLRSKGYVKVNENKKEED